MDTVCVTSLTNSFSRLILGSKKTNGPLTLDMRAPCLIPTTTLDRHCSLGKYTGSVSRNSNGTQPEERDTL